MVIIIIRMVRIIVFAGSRKASKEEQGRKCYNNDSEERHLVGLEGTGQSAQAEEYRLGDWMGPFYKKTRGLYSQGTLVVLFSGLKNWIYLLYGRRAPSYQRKNRYSTAFFRSCREFCVRI